MVLLQRLCHREFGRLGSEYAPQRAKRASQGRVKSGGNREVVFGGPRRSVFGSVSGHSDRGRPCYFLATAGRDGASQVRTTSDRQLDARLQGHSKEPYFERFEALDQRPAPDRDLTITAFCRLFLRQCIAACNGFLRRLAGSRVAGPLSSASSFSEARFGPRSCASALAHFVAVARVVLNAAIARPNSVT